MCPNFAYNIILIEPAYHTKLFKCLLDSRLNLLPICEMSPIVVDMTKWAVFGNQKTKCEN